MSKSLFTDICHNPYKRHPSKLYNESKNNLELIQRLSLLKRLPVHNGCVNTLQWSANGEFILSGSDDQHLVVTNAFNYKLLYNYHTSHTANIFSAKFMPCQNDQKVVSCAGDGTILYTDLERYKETFQNQFKCHAGTSYEVITIPDDPHSFISCGEDGSVRWFDLRLKTNCAKEKCKEDILIQTNYAVTAIAVNPLIPHQLSIGCSDSTVRIYDRRCLSTQGHEGPNKYSGPFCNFMAPNLEDRAYRITSLNYSSDGQDMLVSYSCDHLYLFSILEQHATELKHPMSNWDKVRNLTNRMGGGHKRERRSPPPVRRLRLRGDWSDTGPDARPEREATANASMISQARPQLHTTLMQRMTDVLSRMLNDPMTRAALSAGGEDSLDQSDTSNSNNTPPTTTNMAESNDPRVRQRRNNRPPVYNLNELNEDASALGEDDVTSEAGSTSEVNTATVARHLRNRLSILRSLRQGFIEQHGAEPSVSLRFSNQSSSSSTINITTNAYAAGDALATPTQPIISSVAHAGNIHEIRRAEEEAEMDLKQYENREDAEPHSPDEGSFYKSYEPRMKKKYMGHRNARTMIKEAAFWGEDHVMSGSDCGHVFVWNRHTGALEMLLQADQHVVNCIQPHPSLPYLATSGIDHDIKLWAPLAQQCDEQQGTELFDMGQARGLMRRNEIMLEETKDTITVPAAFMIRMLACLNQIRQVRRGGTRLDDESM